MVVMSVAEAKTKLDVEQLIDNIFNEATKQHNNDKTLEICKTLRECIDFLKLNEPGVMLDAQRSFRSSQYAYTKWCRLMLASPKHNIANVLASTSNAALGTLVKVSVYAGYSKDGMLITASKKQLAKLTETNTKTITKHLNELTKNGILKVVEKSTDSTPATYKISPLYLQSGKIKSQYWLDDEYDEASLLLKSDYIKATADERRVAALIRKPPKFTASKKRIKDGSESVILVPTAGDPTKPSDDK